MLRGLPGSGKSTWARQQVAEKPGQFKRICKDELRAMLDDSRHSKANEAFVLRTRDHLIAEAIRDGKSAIVDDTNLEPRHEERLREIARELRSELGKPIRVVIQDVDTPLDECLRRNARRANPVPGKAIREMHRKWVRPREEAYEREHLHVRQDESLPRAIIVDIDGTIADLNGRDPYDASRCEDDLPHRDVLHLVTLLSIGGYRIIYVSGRSDEYGEQTARWLAKNVGGDCELYMRAAGDFRADEIIKEEILRNEILPHYFVAYVLDDRDRVVRMWRRLGLRCLQVADGNF